MNYRTGFMASMIVILLMLFIHFKNEARLYGWKSALRWEPCIWIPIAAWIGAGLIS